MDIAVTAGFLVLAFMFGAIVEAIAENVLRLFPTTWLEAGKKWRLAELLALVIGVLLCLFMRFGILVMLVTYINEYLGLSISNPPTWFDFIITGILISRGGNWIHDFLTKALSWLTSKSTTV